MVPLPALVQTCQHRPKTTQPRLQVLNDLLGQLIRLRQIIEVGETFVLEPEDIETGFITAHEFFVGIFTPAALRTLFPIPGRLPLVPVLCIVAIDELNQVLKTQRLLLQRVMDVGSVVVLPDFLRPRVLTGFPVIKEDHVRLDSVGVEDARRQAENGVEFRCLK